MELIAYNELSPINQLLISQLQWQMSFYDNLWDISPEQHQFAFSNLYFQPLGDFGQQPILSTESDFKIIQPSIANFHLVVNIKREAQPIDQGGEGLENQKAQLTKSASKLSLIQQKLKVRKKKIKPSPYHNFQKHLNTALKHILTFHPPQNHARIPVLIAQRLWTIFLQSENSTKKILSFIFNEFNEYRIKPNELRELGFEGIYAQCSKSVLAEAKVLLTQMAIDQLSEENIDDYLETRRIKHPQQFKKYLCVFRNELQEGFLKKRFTNRSRKQQMEREFTDNSE